MGVAARADPLQSLNRSRVAPTVLTFLGLTFPRLVTWVIWYHLSNIPRSGFLVLNGRASRPS